MRRPQLCLVLTLIGLSTPSLARADTITITGGSLLSTGLFDVAPPSTLTGSGGFSATGRVAALEARVDPLTFCDGTDACAEGRPFSVGFALDAVDGFLAAAVSYQGISYTDFGAFNGGALSFEGVGSVIAPNFGDRRPVVLSAPFTFSGIFAPPPSANSDLGTLMLIGHGTATVWLTPGPIFEDAPSGWVGQQVRYTFDGPAQTPEASTFLLMSGGLAFILRSRRGRLRPPQRSH